MDISTENISIGTLATQAQVNVETIRFYQRKGLMQEPGRPHGSVRRYVAHDLKRVRFIKSAQRLGFSLDEVAQLLNLEDGTHCDEAREQAQLKLINVLAKLTDLASMEAALADLVERCCAVRGNIRCPLISALQGIDWRLLVGLASTDSLYSTWPDRRSNLSAKRQKRQEVSCWPEA